jgi:hypothetical protein
MIMRQFLIGLTLTAFGSSSAAAAGGCGLLHHRHHGCQRCDETIVIHCYPQEKSSADRRSVFGQESAPASSSTLIPYQPNFGMGAAMGMGMPMQMMPMVMPANFYGYQQPRAPESAPESAKACRCEDAQSRRLDQLEKDFKNLAGQVDEVVKSVNRNTLAIETLVDQLVEQKRLTLPVPTPQ